MKAILNFEFNQSQVRKSRVKKKNRMIVNFLNRVLIIYAR